MIDDWVAFAWHDMICPEGDECRARDLHATAGGGPLLDFVRRIVDRADERNRLTGKAKVIADATDAINYFHDNPDSWAYVAATRPDLVARLQAALPSP